jgi:hypothetical protein
MMIAVRARKGKWTLAYKLGEHRWAVPRTCGTAYGRTALEAASWAYADGGKPAKTYSTKHAAISAMHEDDE